MTKRFKNKKVASKKKITFKSAVNDVYAACKRFGASSMHLFRTGFNWKFKKHDSAEVRKAHGAFKRKVVVDWMREFLKHLTDTGAKTLPA